MGSVVCYRKSIIIISLRKRFIFEFAHNIHMYVHYNVAETRFNVVIL